jgi:drug/metabolite transporter (DMT)-like permease
VHPANAPSDHRARLENAAARHSLALLGLGVVLYATGPVLVQASEVSGPVLSFWRLWLGVPMLAAATWAHRRAGGRLPDHRALRWALWAGLAFGVHQILFMSAVKATSVTDVTLMSTLAPLFVAILAVPLFGERPGTAFRAWTLVAIAGAGVVITGGSLGPEGSPGGMALAAGNTLAFSVFFLISKLGRADIAVLPFLFGVMVVAAGTVSGFVAVVGEPVGAIGGRDLLLAGLIAFVPGLLGHFVMTWPLRWVPANIPPVIKLGMPVVAGFLAWVFLGEGITAAHVTGGVLTLAGVAGAVLTPAGRRFARGPAPQEIPG